MYEDNMHGIMRRINEGDMNQAAEYAIKLGDIGKCIRASRHLRNLGKFEDALRFMRGIRELGNDSAAYWNEIGIIFGKMKKYHAAAEAFAKAARIDGRREAWINLGRVLSLMGKVSLATKCYEIANGRATGDETLFEKLKSEIDGKIKPSGISFISVRDDILEKILKMREDGSGCAIFTSEYISLFRASVAFLVFLMKEMDMDGVLISTIKPSSVYRKIFERKCKEVRLFYINALPFIHDTSDEFVWNVERYSLEDIEYGVDIGIQKIAQKYGGEEHFVFFENVSEIEFYFSKKTVFAFMNKFASIMNRTHIFSFYALPIEKKDEYSRRITFRCRREIKI